MKNLLCCAIVGGLMLTGATFAQSSGDTGLATSASSVQDYSVDYAVVEMETEYELWSEAVFKNDNDRAERHEAILLAMVNRDIFVCQEKVRKLAREVALASSEKPSELPDESQAEERTELQEVFQASIDRLNTKEILYRSATRTKAFSNKYRLLGDYIDILRRELDLPRLKLAEAEKAEPGTQGRHLPSEVGDK
jgi:hypothetical protein